MTEEQKQELLIRYLDENLDQAELAQASKLLREDVGAREFLRSVAEQAVTIADTERTLSAGKMELHKTGNTRSSSTPVNILPVAFKGWIKPVAAAAAIVLLAVFVLRMIPTNEPQLVRVDKVIGSSQVFGFGGRERNDLDPQTYLGAGDTLKSQSCDSWIEMTLEDASQLTVAGRSTLLFLDSDDEYRRLKFLEGSMWFSPSSNSSSHPMLVYTPTIAVAIRGAQFDLQTTENTTILRVNEGHALVTQHVDGSQVEVPAGSQVVASLRRSEPLQAAPQRTPINYWACNLWKVPEIRVGHWLEPTAGERARLGADPLPWPLPNRKEPLMLYAAALSVLSTTDHPVLLENGAKLLVRGRTDSPARVRFGFSTQRMRGVFSGKFEMDVQASELGPAGDTWEVELPIESFKALDPRLRVSSDGLELKTVYALTIEQNAGLEINHIELIPAPDIN